MTDLYDFVPPAARDLPKDALDSATRGASALDAAALTPEGRNLLAHALVQLRRDGWLHAVEPDAVTPGQEQQEPPTGRVEHAKRELELSGQWNEDPAYAQSIVAAVAAFVSYGHSGGSASVAIEQLYRLLRLETLSPLTSDPAEWIDRSEISSAPLWQSARDPKAFSTDGGKTWYRLDSGPNGALYGLWVDAQEPTRTGWITAKNGRVLVSTDPDELPNLGDAQVREFPEPMPVAEWMENA